MTDQAHTSHRRHRPLGHGAPLRLLRLLAGTSLALLVTVAWTIRDESAREWRRWRATFEEYLARSPGGRSAAEGDEGIQQILLPDVERVDRCLTCHRGIGDPELADAPQPFRAHPGTWIETHRPKRDGCTLCHGGQGLATTREGAAHELIAHWPETMRSGEMMEANCGVCHRERQPPAADWLARGRQTMLDNNCVACHEHPDNTVESVRAPSLEGEGFRVNPAWMRAWLRDPKERLPLSRMPDFRLSHDEVEDLTAFLLSLRATPAIEPSGATPGRVADADRGGALFRTTRCVTCHMVDDRGGTTGPELTLVAQKLDRTWLASYLADPHRYLPETMMPRFRFTADEIADLVAFAERDWTDPRRALDSADLAPPDDGRLEAGRQTYLDRGCSACHALEALPTRPRIGPKHTGIGDYVVDEGPLRPRRLKPTLANWLQLKLRRPEALTRVSRMPTFGFTGEEMVAVSIALLSLRDERLPPERVRRDPPVEPYAPQGEFGALVRRYRCLSCHTVHGSGGTLSTVAWDMIGSQLQRDYIEEYLKDPVGVRVSLAERMPRLNPTDDEARLMADHLTRFFTDDRLDAPFDVSADVTQRGKELSERLGCRGCHMAGGRGGYVGPNLDGSDQRLRPGWVRAWLLDAAHLKPGTLEPDYGLFVKDAEALAAHVMTLAEKRAGGTR
jgi:cytochrome c2